MDARLNAYGARRHATWAATIIDALGAQSVVVVGADAVGVVLPHLARQIAEPLGRSFDSGTQLASYAGLTPVTRRSGTSIRSVYVSHAGNKRLKRAMFPSALASPRSDPVSRAYYERKIAQGEASWARSSSPCHTAASLSCTP